MYFISISLSCVFLFVLIWLMARSDWPVQTGLITCVPFFALSMPLVCILPPLAFQVLLLGVAVPLTYFKGVRRYYPIYAVAMSITVYAVMAIQAGQTIRRLRHDFPRESMAGRLPVPPRPNQDEPVDEALVNTVEARFDEENWRTYRSLARGQNLRTLHESTFDAFVEAQGLGVARMLHRFSEEHFYDELREDRPIASPGKQLVVWSSGQWEAVTPKENGGNEENSVRAGLRESHIQGIVNFAYADGFGYLKDRDNVFGFQPHRFSQVPESEGWKVDAIELVGLLMHDEPVVYKTANLPNMKELVKAPTRALDHFEAAGLEKLRAGETLFIGRIGEGLRMLGAVRATRQCVDCHGCKRGDLLGAFSYSLQSR